MGWGRGKKGGMGLGELEEGGKKGGMRLRGLGEGGRRKGWD